MDNNICTTQSSRIGRGILVWFIEFQERFLIGITDYHTKRMVREAHISPQLITGLLGMIKTHTVDCGNIDIVIFGRDEAT
jgi:hypothetical protein